MTVAATAVIDEVMNANSVRANVAETETEIVTVVTAIGIVAMISEIMDPIHAGQMSEVDPVIMIAHFVIVEEDLEIEMTEMIETNHCKIVYETWLTMEIAITVATKAVIGVMVNPK